MKMNKNQIHRVGKGNFQMGLLLTTTTRKQSAQVCRHCLSRAFFFVLFFSFVNLYRGEGLVFGSLMIDNFQNLNATRFVIDKTFTY